MRHDTRYETLSDDLLSHGVTDRSRVCLMSHNCCHENFRKPGNDILNVR